MFPCNVAILTELTELLRKYIGSCHHDAPHGERSKTEPMTAGSSHAPQPTKLKLTVTSPHVAAQGSTFCAFVAAPAVIGSSQPRKEAF